MTIYLAYFDANAVHPERQKGGPESKLGMRFVGTTKTEPEIGGHIYFENSTNLEKLLCAGLSLYGNPRSNPGRLSDKITEVKDPDDNGSLIVEVEDGTYLLVPIK